MAHRHKRQPCDVSFILNSASFRVENNKLWPATRAACVRWVFGGREAFWAEGGTAGLPPGGTRREQLSVVPVYNIYVQFSIYNAWTEEGECNMCTFEERAPEQLDTRRGDKDICCFVK